MNTAVGAFGLKGRSSAETRSAVLDLIRSEGEISRTDLARRSALTEKTISVIVKNLLDAGVIVEAGYAKSTGGKRPILLRLNDKELYAIGLTLDVDRSIGVLCGLDGTEITRIETDGTGQDDPAVVLDRLAPVLLDLLDRRGIDKTSVMGIGVASGGRQTWQREFRSGPDTTLADLWEPYPTEKELGRRTGLRVIRENDANCAALGEYWTSGGSANRDFVTVYMAYGIGAGIVIGGTVYRGTSDNAGEIGHILADPQGPRCWCGRTGCLDAVASPRAITQQIVDDPELRSACRIGDNTSFGEVYRLYARAVLEADMAATNLFRRTSQYLAVAINDVVNTLDLAQVTLAGPGFGQLGEHYRNVVETRLADYAFMRELHPIIVRLSRGGADAAALGAASVVLHRQLTPHQAGVPS
jgi:predicted NBD/HSP70 family sugar kinase